MGLGTATLVVMVGSWPRVGGWLVGRLRGYAAIVGYGKGGVGLELAPLLFSLVRYVGAL